MDASNNPSRLTSDLQLVAQNKTNFQGNQVSLTEYSTSDVDLSGKWVAFGNAVSDGADLYGVIYEWNIDGAGYTLIPSTAFSGSSTGLTDGGFPPPFAGQVGTAATCSPFTMSTANLAQLGTPFPLSNQVSQTYTNAAGGGRDFTLTKVAGTDAVGGDGAELYSIGGAGPVAGIWLGSDDQVPGKSVGTGLDEETYELTFSGDITQTQLTWAALNYNVDGDERIEIVRVEDGSGADVTATTVFQFQSNLGDIVFNAATGRVEGGASYTAAGNDNATLIIDRAAGIRKVVFKRIEIDNTASSKAAPARNRTNGVTMGPIGYCATPTTVDLSDAPTVGTSYGEASHGFDFNFRLGSSIDADPASIANADASGDGAEDDGIVLPTFVAGQSATITASVTGNGALNAWIDWNANGSFNDAGEQIATGVRLTGGATSGTLSIPVTVPASAATATPTFARFRWADNDTLDATSLAAQGEVEDYQVVVQPVTTPAP
ncbi:MAG: GEVED domain-containing protein, partial [Pseudomonadota bacterium]